MKDINDGEIHCVMSPNYNTDPNEQGAYKSGDSCTWMVQVPEGCQAKVWFDRGGFGGEWPRLPILQDGTCADWLEIRDRGTDQSPGPRYFKDSDKC